MSEGRGKGQVEGRGEREPGDDARRSGVPPDRGHRADGSTRDPGAQPERTRFAWRRTTLASGIVVALAWRHALLVRQGAAGFLLAGGTTLVWLVLLTVAQRRMGQLAVSPYRELRRPTVFLVAACVLVMTGCGALLVTDSAR